MTPMTSLVLIRPHTHAGKPLQPGERLDVESSTADWLIAHGIATPEPTVPASEPFTDPEPKPLQRKEPKQ